MTVLQHRGSIPMSNTKTVVPTGFHKSQNIGTWFTARNCLPKEKTKRFQRYSTDSLPEIRIISQDEFMKREGRRLTVVMTGSDILKHVGIGDFVISMRSFQGAWNIAMLKEKSVQRMLC